MGGEGWWEPVSQVGTVVLRALGISGKVQNEEKWIYARYCEPAPSPWGHTERL